LQFIPFLANFCKYITSKTPIHNKKKRDCTIAVSRYQALALPFIPNNNTEAHADMYTRTRLLYKVYFSHFIVV